MKSSKFACIIAVLGLGACTTYQTSPSNPVERSLTWFSFLAGDDIRGACQPGAPDHYRFVYNGIYQLQIRSYELTPTPEGALLEVRARGRSGLLNRFSIDKPLGPWAQTQGRVQLGNTVAANIVDAYADAIAASPSSAGQLFDSNEYYWIVAACSAGNYTLKGFVDPKVDLNALAFPKQLLAHDTTGVPFRKAEPVEGFTDDVFSIRINKAGNNLSGRL